jgi:hypothetical protein
MLAMKRIAGKEPIMALLTGAVLIIGITTTTIYSTGYGVGPSPAAYAAAQTITTVEKIPIDHIDFVPCAADGAGEEIQLTGQANVVTHVTLDNNGGAHIKVHGNYKGVVGTGLTTGDKYQATSAISEVGYIDNLDVDVERQGTFLTKINFIGQGDASNFLGLAHAHATINADGTMTALVINFSFECR